MLIRVDDDDDVYETNRFLEELNCLMNKNVYTKCNQQKIL